MTDPETVARRIERLRAHAVPPLSLEELDDLADLSKGYASKITRGDREEPRKETLAKLAAVLGATAPWLAYGLGREPGARRAREAVQAAREAHRAAQNAPPRRRRKLRGRHGDAA